MIGDALNISTYHGGNRWLGNTVLKNSKIFGARSIRYVGKIGSFTCGASGVCRPLLARLAPH
jgi:hypothetical protein